MRALYAGGAGPVHWRDVPEPRIATSLDVVVRPVAVALCDLDWAYILGVLPTAEPYAVGHELTAEVVEVGDAVRSVHTGSVVTVPFQISCGGCDRCRGGRSLDCRRVPPLSTFGLAPFGGGDWGGAVADRLRVPYGDAMCVPLPAGVDPVAAASVSDNVPDGYRSVAPYVRPGDEVLVLGSASVGLYEAATAVALGVRCTYVDDDDARLRTAERLGAHVVERTPDGDALGEFPVVAACISTPAGLLSALRSTEPGGICHSSGIQFFGTELPLVDMYRRGVRFVTGRASARDDIPAVLRLIGQGRLPVGAVTARTLPFDAAGDLADAFSHKTVLVARA